MRNDTKDAITRAPEHEAHCTFDSSLFRGMDTFDSSLFRGMEKCASS
jgi:hypothetical protein